jgi:hypothetical protein
MSMENIIQLQQRKISLFVQAVGLVFFGVLFYIGWQFYLERVIGLDSGFNLFQLMQGDKFISTLKRYGDFIPQVLPYLAYKMDFPLHSIIVAYSVSFIILHYFIFLFVTLVLKNNAAGIAIMLTLCLSYYHVFYTPMLELNESLVAAIMLWAFIHPETPYYTTKQKNLYSLGALLTIVYMSFLHPSGIIAILFIIGVEIVGAKRYRDLHLWAVLIIGIGWFYLKGSVFFRVPYDHDHIIPISEMWHQLPNWRSWPSTQYVIDFTYLHFGSLKWFLILIVLLTIRKGWLFFFFVTGFILLFTVIYLATLYKGDSPVYYEDYYCYYGFFAGLLFVFLFYHPRRKHLVILLAIPLLFMGVHRIYEARTIFSERIAYLDRIIDKAEKTKERKCIVDERCYPFEYAMAPWNVTFETIMYSSVRGLDSTVTIFIKNPDFNKLSDSAVIKPKPNVLLGVHFAPTWYASSDLPEEYFKLPSTGYTYLTHSQDDTSFHENLYSASNVKIIPLVLSAESKMNTLHTVIPLIITNTSGRVIPSIPSKKDGVYLAYKLYDSKGKEVKNEKDALETDINAASEEGLLVYYPREKGVYSLLVDLVTDGKRSWNLPVQHITITVE